MGSPLWVLFQLLRIHHWGGGKVKPRLKKHGKALKDFTDKGRMRKLKSCG